MKTLMLVVLSLVVPASVSRAADTVETWGAGQGNVELYSAYEGVGQTNTDQAIGGEMLVGWGASDRFSVFLGTSLQANGYLTGAESELDLGAFGTPLDTDHWDLDLLLDMRVGGYGMSQATVAPAFEINLDRTPDLSSYGVFLRAGADIVGRQSEAGRDQRHVDLGLTVGSYLTLNPSHQILLEYDSTLHDKPGPETPNYEHGALALGYNAILSGRMELITEARLDIPQNGESSALGLMVGIITTLTGPAQ